jgi:hypothetical protein
LAPKSIRRTPDTTKKILELMKLVGTSDTMAYPKEKKTRHMAIAKLQPMRKPFLMPLLTPTEYVKYIETSAREHGERNVVIP